MAETAIMEGGPADTQVLTLSEAWPVLAAQGAPYTLLVDADGNPMRDVFGRLRYRLQVEPGYVAI